MSTYKSNLERKLKIRNAMYDVEMKLKKLRDTPESIPVVDEEIDNDIVYWQKKHDELLEMYRGKPIG